MIIGILSDTHGRDARLKAALEILRQRGAQAVVHCGDIGTFECLEILGQCGIAAYAVAGNVDAHLPNLEAQALKAGVTFSSEVVEVPLSKGQYLVATHGHDEAILSELLVGQQFPYVCHGHTHKTRDERIGSVRVINPGALFNCRGPNYHTVALLDTQTDELEFLKVPRWC
jgi:uncharacterized protein